MEAILNPNSDSQSSSIRTNSEKSELMQFFESQVNDMYWAYKDLLKAMSEAKD